MNPGQLLAALLLELGAGAFILRGDTSTAFFLGFLGSHASASALFALTLYPVLPARWRETRVATLALCFSLSFFLPFLGLVTLLIALLAARLFPVGDGRGPWVEPALPELHMATPRRARGLRGLSLRPLLSDVRLPAGLRSRALNALSTMPLRVGGGLLRRLLADPVEDLRLVAYGMLDGSEKSLRGRIAAQTEALDAGRADGAPRAAGLRALAELNFELAYQGLVQGDLRSHALQQALRHAEAGLALAPPDAGLLFLRGRIHAARADPGAARADFTRAAALGLPAARVQPQLAELAFAERDWPAVRAAMAPVAALLAAPRSAALASFWHHQGPFR